MIFVTVGTTHFPFARLFDALGEIDGLELVVQHGTTDAPDGALDARAFMSSAEIADCMQAADAVVSHAGVGSILGAVQAGHIPVVVPRLRRLGETVDDHQVQLARALALEGKVIAVEDVSELEARLRDPSLLRLPPRGDLGQLQHAVRAALLR